MKNPEIRFKNDNIDWQTKQLKEVSIPLKSGTLTQDKLSPDGKYPVINGGISYYGYYDDYNNENAFTISARGENAGFCRFSKDKFWAGGLCYPYKGKGLFDTHFISILLNKHEKEIKENYVIRTSIPAVNKSDIEHFNMKFPIISVQKEISSLLLDIDQKISSQEVLIHKLKTTKSAMLTKMFPQENQSDPELRFTGYTDAWEQRKLVSLLELLKDGTHGTHRDVEIGPLLLSAKNIKSGKVIWNDTDRKISQNDFNRIHSSFSLSEGDVLLTIVGSIGETAILKEPNMMTFQRSVAILKPNKYLLSEFLYTEIQTNKFQKDLESRKSTSAQSGVYLGELSEIQITFPLSCEQTKISKLFNSLDNLIALHQRKLDKLKEIKAALLDKLLV